MPDASKSSHDRYRRAAAALLRSELTQRGLTYRALAERLNERRPGAETETTIKLKMSRGSFQAAFLFECLEAMGADTVVVSVRTLLGDGA
ncbi:DUF6471 domain-containing protein [Ralstonia pseudosolanacearum]|uniref:DUF6471 domain-containing protein n=1 Tax=Ralstonia pseudosolanacearum TaxID=1310165 RepID=UPI0007DB3396|nr:DUF6471 domain-containing protein [Ralstonia pseudosolanacearum]MDC6296213.1 DUF6471 domain-containing protein [Ralstonia pseudosolanacearum]MDD7791814.1 DUF6471 domain-containing protein [Ralstonia pseudosolanacearum]MDN3368851.1 DUF6471 domain-containing protein [Ralstonia pseudosolanacearum]